MALCQICGTTVELPAPVTCERCETPHHQDCWLYLGSCSTYACTGLRLAPAGATSAIQRPPAELEVLGGRGATWRVRESVIQWSTYAAEPPFPGSARAIRVADVHLPPRTRVDYDPIQGSRLPSDGLYQSAAATLLLLLAVSGAKLPLVLVFAVPTTLAAISLRGARWLVHDPVAQTYHVLRHGLTGRWSSDPPLERPFRVSLTRNLADGVLSYILVVEWSAVVASALSPPISIPEGDADRQSFLDRLLAARTLGPQIAAALGIPYTEQLLAKKH